MSRSIHTTYSKFIKLKRKYDENKKPELKEKLDTLYNDLNKKHIVKRQIHQQRKGDPLEDSCMNADDILIFFSDESPLIHYPISESDIRSVLNQLPKGIFKGLKSIGLRFGGWDWECTYDLDPDPFTGRPGYETIPGVYFPPILGSYFRRDSRIELYAFTYSTMPDENIWMLYLKINMLMTLVHEIFHHYDFISRRSRGRWIMESYKTEAYAEKMEYKWFLDAMVEYIQRTYPLETAELISWLQNKSGIPLTIKDIVEDPRRTHKNGFVKIGSGMDNCIRDFIKNYYLGKDILEVRMSLAEGLHDADFYDYALEIIDNILNTENANTYRYRALTLKADTLVHLEKYLEAQKIITEALAINQQGFEVWDILCDIYENLSQWDLLLEASCKSYQLCTNEISKPRISLTQVRSLIELGRFEEAEKILDSVDVSKRKVITRKVNELRAEIQSRLHS